MIIKCGGIKISRSLFQDRCVWPFFLSLSLRFDGPPTPRVTEDMPEKLVRKRGRNKYFASTFEGDSAERKGKKSHWASVRSRRGLTIADSLHPGRIPLVFLLGFPLASPLPEILIHFKPSV